MSSNDATKSWVQVVVVWALARWDLTGQPSPPSLFASKPQNLACSDSDKTQTQAKKHQSTNSQTNVARVKRHIPSTSTTLVMGAELGILQNIFLISLARPLLGIMGLRSVRFSLLEPAKRYLKLRSLSAPAVLLSLAMQGVFRGFKDTTTPLYATFAGDLANVVLDPILIFVCHMGVSGEAITHVLSQVIAATSCVTLAASLAARLGTTPMTAFQICLQVWMASSLLANSLAVAGQAIIARAFTEKDYQKKTAAASRVLQGYRVLVVEKTETPSQLDLRRKEQYSKDNDKK
ncbi:hypothetical protein AgCh_011839 [Apium graveolens]